MYGCGGVGIVYEGDFFVVVLVDWVVVCFCLIWMILIICWWLLLLRCSFVVLNSLLMIRIFWWMCELMICGLLLELRMNRGGILFCMMLCGKMI